MVEAVRGRVSVQRVCSLMKVSPSGYYAWRQRGMSPRAKEDRLLVIEVCAITRQSRGTNGAPRFHAELRARGFGASLNRVTRLVRKEGIKAVRRRRRRPVASPAPLKAIQANVLDRAFTPERPNVVWTADITYLLTAEGWLYLAVVMDLYSRRIVGWTTRPSLAKELPVDALQAALLSRAPAPGLLHHSDRGSQYTSHRYQDLLRRNGVQISMSRKGQCHDNAPMESFTGTLKTEMHLRGDPFESHDEARRALFEYIEVFYNRQRRHSTLGYQTPAEFEQQYIQ